MTQMFSWRKGGEGGGRGEERTRPNSDLSPANCGNAGWNST